MFSQWPIVEADLHDFYGIDVADKSLMTSRSWRWLGVRLDGLAMCDSRIVAWARRRFETENPGR